MKYKIMMQMIDKINKRSKTIVARVFENEVQAHAWLAVWSSYADVFNKNCCTLYFGTMRALVTLIWIETEK